MALFTNRTGIFPVSDPETYQAKYPNEEKISFRGNSWEECSDFIQSIRAAAWKEGKLGDPTWMADLASIHFELDALAWYSHLESDVQADWSKLQVALVDHWSAPDSLI
ncbi:hypothetical protein FRB90_009267, partial [Tulasnella sp. 427]